MRIGARIMPGLAAIGLATGGLAMPSLAASVQRKPPYFASISASKARMRTGPSKSYPASWLYRRANLPVKVLDTFKEKGGAMWYKVEDPGGTQGWMLDSLISDTRTAMVMGTIIELRDSPRPAGRVLWRAAPNVVGRLSKCAQGWCWFDVRGQGGYVEADRVWGVDPGETVN